MQEKRLRTLVHLKTLCFGTPQELVWILCVSWSGFRWDLKAFDVFRPTFSKRG